MAGNAIPVGRRVPCRRPCGGLGMYWVRVTDGEHMKVKKLIIH
jgi:hypothetical protein